MDNDQIVDEHQLRDAQGRPIDEHGNLINDPLADLVDGEVVPPRNDLNLNENQLPNLPLGNQQDLIQPLPVVTTAENQINPPATLAPSAPVTTVPLTAPSNQAPRTTAPSSVPNSNTSNTWTYRCPLFANTTIPSTGPFSTMYNSFRNPSNTMNIRPNAPNSLFSNLPPSQNNPNGFQFFGNQQNQHRRDSPVSETTSMSELAHLSKVYKFTFPDNPREVIKRIHYWDKTLPGEVREDARLAILKKAFTDWTHSELIVNYNPNICKLSYNAFVEALEQALQLGSQSVLLNPAGKSLRELYEAAKNIAGITAGVNDIYLWFRNSLTDAQRCHLDQATSLHEFDQRIKYLIQQEAEARLHVLRDQQLLKHRADHQCTPDPSPSNPQLDILTTQMANLETLVRNAFGQSRTEPHQVAAVQAQSNQHPPIVAQAAKEIAVCLAAQMNHRRDEQHHTYDRGRYDYQRSPNRHYHRPEPRSNKCNFHIDFGHQAHSCYGRPCIDFDPQRFTKWNQRRQCYVDPELLHAYTSRRWNEQNSYSANHSQYDDRPNYSNQYNNHPSGHQHRDDHQSNYNRNFHTNCCCTSHSNVQQDHPVNHSDSPANRTFLQNQNSDFC